ncbi:hypothetical protein [Ammoniphilus sp. CFH 90114]|uniref:hypothetical protein n=1 Tax=Ammoniphilus sp. CFH 90114 TaxID=2493665 RepID=UPI00102852AC|nr:hypothetical protein [Ammoniphilus sp. CFH 90114]RXT06281.1 hypothetical protein EIZ39_14435 [Ammoniphilus sp. CFH 90114]
MIWDKNQPQAPQQYPMNFQNPYMAPRPPLPSPQLPGQSSGGLPNLNMKNIQAIIDRMGGVDGLVKMAGEIQKLYQTAQPIINLMAGLLAKPKSDTDSGVSEVPVKKRRRKKRTTNSRKKGRAKRRKKQI